MVAEKNKNQDKPIEECGAEPLGHLGMTKTKINPLKSFSRRFRGCRRFFTTTETTRIDKNRKNIEAGTQKVNGSANRMQSQARLSYAEVPPAFDKVNGTKFSRQQRQHRQCLCLADCARDKSRQRRQHEQPQTIQVLSPLSLLS